MNTPQAPTMPPQPQAAEGPEHVLPEELQAAQYIDEKLAELPLSRQEHNQGAAALRLIVTAINTLRSELEELKDQRVGADCKPETLQPKQPKAK